MRNASYFGGLSVLLAPYLVTVAGCSGAAASDADVGMGGGPESGGAASATSGGSGGATAAEQSAAMGGARTDDRPEPTCIPGTREFSLGPETQSASINNLTSNLGANFSDKDSLTGTSWTNSGVPHSWRSLLRFQLPELHADESVSQATLHLSALTHRNTYRDGGGHSSLTNSNASSLLALETSWDEAEVTWNNQPEAGEAVAKLSKSESHDEDYAVDLTDWVTDVYDGETSNYGLMLRLDSESHYASLIFDSPDADPTTGTRPILELTTTCD